MMRGWLDLCPMGTSSTGSAVVSLNTFLIPHSLQKAPTESFVCTTTENTYNRQLTLFKIQTKTTLNPSIKPGCLSSLPLLCLWLNLLSYKATGHLTEVCFVWSARNQPLTHPAHACSISDFQYPFTKWVCARLPRSYTASPWHRQEKLSRITELEGKILPLFLYPLTAQWKKQAKNVVSICNKLPHKPGQSPGNRPWLWCQFAAVLKAR